MNVGAFTVHFGQTLEGKKPKRQRVVITARMHRGPCVGDIPRPKPCSVAPMGEGRAVLNPIDKFDVHAGQSLALANAMRQCGLPKDERKALGKVFKEQTAPAFHVTVHLRQGRRVVKAYTRTFSNQHKLGATARFDEAVDAVKPDPE